MVLEGTSFRLSFFKDCFTCVSKCEGSTLKNNQLQVLEEATGLPVANVTSTTPDLMVNNLISGRDYIVEVRAVNSKGKSPPFLLQGFALKVAENKIRK